VSIPPLPPGVPALPQHALCATLDMETYSEAGYRWDEEKRTWLGPEGSNAKGLGAVGSRKYAEHPTAEVLTFSYSLPNGLKGRWVPGQPCPPALAAHIARCGLIEAHNAMFERNMWTFVLVRKHGFPPINPVQWRCSMSKARAAGYPGALAQLGAAMRLNIQKDKRGADLIKLLCMPRKPTKADPRLRILPSDDPEAFEGLQSYCDTDRDTEHEASSKLPDLIPSELAYWQADQAVNFRGLGVDLPHVEAACEIVNQTLAQFGAECERLTGGIGPSKVQALAGWCTAMGVRMESLDAESLETALKRTDLPPVVRRVLEIRQLTGSASVKKVFAMRSFCSDAGRLHDLFIYHGARTGRDTHADVQPGNLPKAGPRVRQCGDMGCQKWYGAHGDNCPWCGASSAFSSPLEDWKFEAVADALATIATRSAAAVQYVFGDALLTVSGVVRSLIVAAPGHDLICSDYSSIEAVVIAELAGEQWRIDAFARREDIYLHGAAGVTGLTYEVYKAWAAEHNRKHPDRQKIGKPCLGPQTQVLTDRGYVAIVDVLQTDKVWDGEEWVSHEGLLDQGIKDTLHLDGIRITPDHLVNMNGSWREARQLVSSPDSFRQALATGSANLPSSAIQYLPRATGKPWCSAVAKENPIGCLSQTYGKASQLDATHALSERRGCIERCTTAMRLLCRMTNIDAGCSTGSLRRADAATTRSLNSSRPTEGGGSSSTPLGEKTVRSSSDMSRPYLAGTIRDSRWIERTVTEVMSPAIYDLSPVKSTRLTNERSMTRTRKSCDSSAKSSDSSNVYDLANAGPRRRFTIKTDSGHLLVHNCELGLGFGGWIGALFAFGYDGSEDEAREIVQKWRAASPMIVELWGGQFRGTPWAPTSTEFYGLEGMAVQAVLNPGQRFTYRLISFEVDPAADVLYMILPSGRRISYREPRLTHGSKREGWAAVYELTFMTHNSNPKMGPLGWVRMPTYGGRLAENATQAVARDIMANAVVNLEQRGYPVVLRVHDEIASEVPKGFGSVEEFEAIMQDLPTWATGWPIRAAGGYRAERYRKD